MHKRTALVTGASSGIGLAIARELLQDVNVVLTSSSYDRLDAACSSLISSGIDEKTISLRVMDVTDRHQIESVIGELTQGYRDIDILINAAGIGGGGITKDTPYGLWQRILDVNLNGVFLVTREVLNKSRMIENGWGRIINIASTGGKQGVVFAAAYSASKHGVVGFTKSLGLELAKTGVTVNAVCPGFVETRLAENARSQYARIWNCPVEEAKQRIEQRIPLGRYIETNEVAGLARFLASERSGAILAQAINVCGGLGNY